MDMSNGTGRDGMGLTLRQAAEQCGASRSTIHRALKSGKMSGIKAKDGAWSIDPSELARVFPWDVSGPVQRDMTDRARDGEDHGAAVLAMQVQMLESQLERERDTVEDLRRRLDRAEDRVLALTMQARQEPPREPLGRSWWAKLVGR